MRRFLLCLPLLLAASCGRPSEESSVLQESTTTAGTAEERAADAASAPMAASGPNIGPTAAPGVAFNYRYAFRLAAERIARVQEEHAQACERLGVDRCRITGMRYRLVNDGDIEAMLALKLDPAVARQFGKAAAERVVQNEGMLVDSEISGEDVGSEIKSAGRTLAQMRDDLQRIEEQLARTGPRAAERAQLQQQAQELRDAIRANLAGQSVRQELLAKTPMVFVYGSGELAPGFDTRSPLSSAVRQGGENIVEAFRTMLLIAMTLLPWLLLGLVTWWVWRRVRRPAPTPPPAAVEPDEPRPEGSVG